MDIPGKWDGYDMYGIEIKYWMRTTSVLLQQDFKHRRWMIP